MAFDAGAKAGPLLEGYVLQGHGQRYGHEEARLREILMDDAARPDLRRTAQQRQGCRGEEPQPAGTPQTISVIPMAQSRCITMRSCRRFPAHTNIFSTILKQELPPQRPMFRHGPRSSEIAIGKCEAINLGRHGLCIGPHPEGSQFDRHADRKVGNSLYEGTDGLRARDEERAQ